MIETEQLTKDVKYYLRIILFTFIFFVGVVLGQMNKVNIYYLRYTIIFCMGMMVALGFILGKLEDEEK